MADRKRPELDSSQQDAANRQRAQEELRDPDRDMYAPGLGRRMLQLIELPAFAPPNAWEVRLEDGVWLLYSSTVAETWPGVRLRGYERIAIDSSALHAFFTKVTLLTLPIAPDLNGEGGRDGRLFRLTIFGDALSGIRFQWWDVSPPPQWESLISIGTEMVKVFTAAENAAVE